MKTYYYVKDSQRMGPYSYSQLEAEGITPDTLVWFEGLSSWQFAKDISELDEIFESRSTEPSVESLPALPLVNVKEEDVIKEAVEKKDSHTAADASEESTPELVTTRQGMFSNPFGIKGRIRRTEYWLSMFIFYIYVIVVGAMTGGIEDHASGDEALFMVLLSIPAYWFIIVQAAKRCHDRGNSGWFQIIPFYGLWMAFAEGDFNYNQYGPNPKR